MFKNAMLSVGAFAVIASSFALATPADAKRGKHRHYNSSRYYDNGYNNPYRGQRYRNYYRECDKGRGGTAIGAVAGGLAGHEIAGRGGDRTVGAVLGAVVGGVAGNVIDRADDPCRRRYR